MARKPSSENGHNGHSRLEDAVATLIQTQASFVAQMAESERRHLAYERETTERFARIEVQMAEIIRVLNEHGRILSEHTRLIESLTDAVREKIGFKG